LVFLWTGGKNSPVSSSAHETMNSDIEAQYTHPLVVIDDGKTDEGSGEKKKERIGLDGMGWDWKT
jgi:hypothetical protein